MRAGTTILRKKNPVQHIAKTVAAQRFDPDEDFTDVIGDTKDRFALDNERPDRHYIWAHNSPDDIQAKQSDVLGYTVEYYAGDDVADALRPRGSRGMFKQGDMLRIADHVCMSCDREKWEKRERYEAKRHAQITGKLTQARQRDTVAGAHSGEWEGLGDYRS